MSSSDTAFRVLDNLSDLDDVALATPTQGQSLTFNASTSKWINSTVTGGGGSTTTLTTTAPLAGGGSLAGNLTLSIAAATATAAGSMSTTHFSLLNGATFFGTANTLAKRGASGELYATLLLADTFAYVASLGSYGYATLNIVGADGDDSAGLGINLTGGLGAGQLGTSDADGGSIYVTGGAGKDGSDTDLGGTGGNVTIAGGAAGADGGADQGSQGNVAISGSTVSITALSSVFSIGLVTNTVTNHSHTIANSGVYNIKNHLGTTLVGISDTSGTVAINAITSVTGDVKILVAGNGLCIKEGTNATMGTATLNGTTAVTVSTTRAAGLSRIFVQRTLASLNGVITVTKAANSFTLKSSVASDVGTVDWFIINQAP